MNESTKPAPPTSLPEEQSEVANGEQVDVASRTTLASFGRAFLVAAYNFSADGCFNKCAAISYYALLSVVPSISFLAVMLGYFLGSSEQGMQATLERLQTLLPQLSPQLVESAETFLQYSATIGIASLLATIWVSRLVFASIQTAVTQILHVPSVQTSWRLLALRALWDNFKPFLLFFGAAAAFASAFVLQNMGAVMRDSGSPLAQEVMRFLDSLPDFPVLVSLAITAVVFSLVLQLLSPPKLTWRALLPAAGFAAIGWEAANQLFAGYLRYATRAMSFTGSAGAAMIFMLWIYYAAAVFLFRVELAAATGGHRR